MATTAGRRVPLPFSAALGAAGSAFFGDEILRFSAAFGVLCFSAIEFAPWSKTLSECFNFFRYLGGLRKGFR